MFEMFAHCLRYFFYIIAQFERVGKHSFHQVQKLEVTSENLSQAFVMLMGMALGT